jgi:hypothetical protein
MKKILILSLLFISGLLAAQVGDYQFTISDDAVPTTITYFNSRGGNEVKYYHEAQEMYINGNCVDDAVTIELILDLIDWGKYQKIEFIAFDGNGNEYYYTPYNMPENKWLYRYSYINGELYFRQLAHSVDLFNYDWTFDRELGYWVLREDIEK